MQVIVASMAHPPDGNQIIANVHVTRALLVRNVNLSYALRRTATTVGILPATGQIALAAALLDLLVTTVNLNCAEMTEIVTARAAHPATPPPVVPVSATLDSMEHNVRLRGAMMVTAMTTASQVETVQSAHVSVRLVGLDNGVVLNHPRPPPQSQPQSLLHQLPSLHLSL